MEAHDALQALTSQACTPHSKEVGGDAFVELRIGEAATVRIRTDLRVICVSNWLSRRPPGVPIGTLKQNYSEGPRVAPEPLI